MSQPSTQQSTQPSADIDPSYLVGPMLGALAKRLREVTLGDYKVPASSESSAGPTRLVVLTEMSEPLTAASQGLTAWLKILADHRQPDQSLATFQPSVLNDLVDKVSKLAGKLSALAQWQIRCAGKTGKDTWNASANTDSQLLTGYNKDVVTLRERLKGEAKRCVLTAEYAQLVAVMEDLDATKAADLDEIESITGPVEFTRSMRLSLRQGVESRPRLLEPLEKGLGKTASKLDDVAVDLRKWRKELRTVILGPDETRALEPHEREMLGRLEARFE